MACAPLGKYARILIRRILRLGIQPKRVGPDLDIEVRGGDSIYVHRASVIYVFGQVQRPGQFTLERDMNVRQALAKAGGFTMRARESKVLVQRTGRDGKASESELGLDDAVLADDQIYVRESLF